MSEAHRMRLVAQLQSPRLNDLPGRLRHLADRIERGEVQTDRIILSFDDEVTNDLVVIAFGDYTPEQAYFQLGLSMRRLEGAV